MRIHTIETLLEIIKSTLESGKDVVISGFGKFCVKIKLMIIPHGKLSPKTLQAFIEEFVTRDGTDTEFENFRDILYSFYQAKSVKF